MKDKYQKLYAEAVRIIGDKTPLKKDCGLICGGECCKGDDETGMLLFPFEESVLAVKEKDGVRLAVCKSHCQRQERPLSCRIFPFFPSSTLSSLTQESPTGLGRKGERVAKTPTLLLPPKRGGLTVGDHWFSFFENLQRSQR